MRRISAARYVTPLREGGSLPAVVEGSDGALHVVKFRGAGQGGRALAAELLAGEIGRAAGLRVPELCLVDLEPGFGKSEPDAEIRDLLLGSAGVNLAMAYLPGAVAFDLATRPAISAELASAVVAFDAFVTNVDRTAKNPNMLWWRGDLWLIDHGAALYWHHGWEDRAENGGDDLAAAAARPFVRIADHVLLGFSDRLPGAGDDLARRLDDATLERIVALLPDLWLEDAPGLRAAYLAWLRARRAAMAIIIEEAVRARASRV
jgi:hypothetical protein